jgi:hypothetical protein
MLDTTALWAIVLGDPSSGTTGNSYVDLGVQLLQYGLVGLLLIDVVGTHKFLIPRWVSDRDAAAQAAVLLLKDQQIADLRGDLLELKTAQAELQKQMQERYIPALVQVTEIAKDYLEELRRRGLSHGM